MPQTGVLTPTNLGISTTRPCTEQQVSQSLSNIANNLINLQTQIGDPSTLPPILAQIPGLEGLPGAPGGPGTPGADGPAGAAGIDLTGLLRQILQTIGQIINGGLGEDKFVAVNSSDTPDYLENQWRDGHVQASAQYTASQDLLTEVDTVDVAGDKKCRLYIDVGDITGWDGSLTVQQTLTFAVTTGFATMVEAGQIKVATGQTLKFVGAAFEQTGTFATATDLKTYEETIGSTPNKSMRVFSRFSDVSGWNASNKQVLWNDGGTLKWVDSGAASTGTKTETVVTDVSWDTGTCVMTKTTDSIRIFND